MQYQPRWVIAALAGAVLALASGAALAERGHHEDDRRAAAMLHLLIDPGYHGYGGYRHDRHYGDDRHYGHGKRYKRHRGYHRGYSRGHRRHWGHSRGGSGGSGGSDCHTVDKRGYHDGRKAIIVGIMCYDRQGDPYVVRGSRRVLDYD